MNQPGSTRVGVGSLSRSNFEKIYNPIALTSPIDIPPIQIAFGVKPSFNKPPVRGAAARASPQPSQYRLIYLPRIVIGARSATYLLAVGARMSSPKVRITMLSQNPQNPLINATLPAPNAYTRIPVATTRRAL